MSVEDSVVSLLMKTFFATQLFNIDEQFCVLSEYWGKKLHCLCAPVCLVLSCDSTCLAPCCECSHWAVITHLGAVWNIHSQVSPSLWVTHMDYYHPHFCSQPRSLYSTCLLLHPTHLSASGCTMHSHPVLSLELKMPLSHSLLIFFSSWISDRVSGSLWNSWYVFAEHMNCIFVIFIFISAALSTMDGSTVFLEETSLIRNERWPLWTLLLTKDN